MLTAKVILKVNMHSNPTTSACAATALRVATIDVNLAMSSHVECLYEYTTPATSPTGTTSAVSFGCNEPVQVKMFTDLPPQGSTTLNTSKMTHDRSRRSRNTLKIARTLHLIKL